MNDRYSLIKTSAYPGVSEVRFYDETLEHIKEEHPEVPIELPCILNGVKNCVITPTHVEASYGRSYVFVDFDTTNASGYPLRVR